MPMNTVIDRAGAEADRALTMTEVSGELEAILTDALGELSQLQLGACSSSFAQNLASLVPIFAPAGTEYFLKTMPQFLGNQATGALRVLADSAVVISHTQQRLLEWQLRSWSISVGEAPGIFGR